MKNPLRILHLEDDPYDAEIVQHTLEAAGIATATTCVHNRDGFVAALENGGIDLILSDFSLPEFDGLSAVAIAHAGWPDLPVILVSGSLGEELAIGSLKKGATDYVLKQRLSRLGPAVHRAMLEVETRAERQRLETQLIEAQKREVLGQLAGGVAHDFNNILSVVLGYTALSADALDAGSPLQEYTEEIRHASNRAVGFPPSFPSELRAHLSGEPHRPLALVTGASAGNDGQDRQSRGVPDLGRQLVCQRGRTLC